VWSSGQLGNTGIIVLNTCDEGDCDCSKFLDDQVDNLLLLLLSLLC
jgi:hypothetical protein